MRVLSLLFSSVFGGPHNRNCRISPLLRQKGVELVVGIPDEPGNALEMLQAAGLEVVALPTRRLRRTLNLFTHLGFAAGFWRDVGLLRGVIKERDIDVVLINGVVHPHGAIAAAREGIPVVWQILENAPMPLKYALMPLVAKYADVVMTTGMTLAASYPGALHLKDRLISFFPPVNVDLFRSNKKSKPAARNALGIADDAIVIGTIGNLNPDKDHLTFIRAAASLKREVPGARFVILGSTYKERAAYTEMLYQEAAGLGLKIGSDLIVRNPAGKVAELAQAFDIFWLTSRTEGMPAVIGEAMALELPIVATNVGSVREAVVDGKTGFIAGARDWETIARRTLPLVRDSGLRANLGAAGRRFAEQYFDVRVCAGKHLRAFAAAAKEPELLSQPA